MMALLKQASKQVSSVAVGDLLIGLSKVAGTLWALQAAL